MLRQDIESKRFATDISRKFHEYFDKNKYT